MVCPSCKNEIRDGIKFCNKCGAKIEPATKLICPNCGKELKPGQKFCSGCGTKIEETKTAEHEKTASTPKPTAKTEVSKSTKTSETAQPPVNNSNIIDYRDTIFGTKIDLDMSSFVKYKGQKFS